MRGRTLIGLGTPPSHVEAVSGELYYDKFILKVDNPPPYHLTLT
jgi:hypothetical protein